MLLQEISMLQIIVLKYGDSDEAIDITESKAFISISNEFEEGLKGMIHPKILFDPLFLKESVYCFAISTI